ncbi:MAG: RNA methyltransferase [Allomuricauda sp.]|nr:MAG: RNA methyltransferase [Allomuricauda sp.]
MVTKKQIKVVKNLVQKKYRNEYGLFVAEGIKLVKELLDAGFNAHMLFVTSQDLAEKLASNAEIIAPNDLKKMSNMHSSNAVLAVFEIPKSKPIDQKDWVLALDAVRDPGNLGTIIRLCDWFGVKQLVCSSDTVDCYNPKVLQATMGSIARVNVVYTDLDSFLKMTTLPVLGAYMAGDEVYRTELPERGILVMGNEARGISDTIGSRITKKIAIPQFGEPSAESLNVATATAILLNEIRRSSFIQK